MRGKGVKIRFKLMLGFIICVILSAMVGVIAVIHLTQIRVDTAEIKNAKNIEKEILECRRQEKNIILFGPYEEPTLGEEREKTYLEKFNDNLITLRESVKYGKKITEKEKGKEKFDTLLIEIENYETSLKKIVADYDKSKKEIDGDSLTIMRKDARRIQESANKLMELAQTKIDAAYKTALITVWMGLVLAVVFGVGVGGFFSRSITNPIRKLTVMAELIATKGDLTQQVDIESGDEIGELANSFNKMVEDLRNSQEKIHAQNEEVSISNEELTVTNEELETTTEELQKANKNLEVLKGDLEKRVEKRTVELQKAKQELEKKIFELERFNKLAVDRELKMVEMKKRIKELGEKLKG